MDCMKKAQDAQLRILAMQDRLVDPPVILREADIAHFPRPPFEYVAPSSQMKKTLDELNAAKQLCADISGVNNIAMGWRAERQITDLVQKFLDQANELVAANALIEVFRERLAKTDSEGLVRILQMEIADLKDANSDLRKRLAERDAAAIRAIRRRI